MKSWSGRASRTWAVATHTLRETVRDRVFAVSLIFAALLLTVSLVLGPLVAGQQDKLIQDFGLASISGIGIMLAVFVGTSLVYREVERRTIYTLLARPIGRGEYLIGKYAGMVLTLLLNIGLMGSLFLLLVHFHLGAFSPGLLAAIYLTAWELALVAAFSILFSVVSSPFLGAFFTLIVFVMGHLSRDILYFAKMLPEGAGRTLVEWSSYLLPNLEYFNVKGMAVYGKPISSSILGGATVYGALYITAVISLAVILFQRKDLK